MEKNFVIDKNDLPNLKSEALNYYGKDAIFLEEDPLDISISYPLIYVNLMENIHYQKEFPVTFIEMVKGVFSSPVYFFLSTNSEEKGDELLRILSAEKIFFDEREYV